MLLFTEKRLLRPKQIANLRTLVKYSAIAFCLSGNTNTVASSFSLESTSTHRLTSTFNTLAPVQRSPFLVHRGGSINPLKMVSTSTDAANANAPVVTAGEKLEALRSKMKELDLDAYIVPTDDPHLCEYVPEAYMRRKFLTGFGGSAGTAVVFSDEALLWADSRYVMLCSDYVYELCMPRVIY